MTRAAWLFLSVVVGYFLLLAGFHTLDLYHNGFEAHGLPVVAWQAMRLVFIPYLLWLCYAPGARIVPHPVAACLAGAALWHIALFAVGLAGLYTYPVMLMLSGAVMISSYRQLVSAFSTFRFPCLSGEEKLLAALAALAGGVFLLAKGLYPSGGMDFYSMYYPYYLAVLRDGSLGPNELWYQYFYGKGAGLFFMSMLLTDPLAMHMASSSLVALAAAVIYAWVMQASSDRRMALLAVLLYVACYIYTPAFGKFEFTGGWGDLEKIHETLAVFMLGALWLISRLEAGRGYFIALMLTCVTVVILSLEAGLVMGFTLLLLMPLRLLRKPLFLAGAATGAAIIAMHGINLLATGIPSIQAVAHSLNYISWPRLVELGTTLEYYILRNGMLTLDPLQKLSLPVALLLGAVSLRLFLWWPFFAVVPALAVLSRRKVKNKLPTDIWPLLALMLATIVAMVAAGGKEPLSFFRFTTFAYAPTLLAAMFLWSRYPQRILALRMTLVLLLCSAFALMAGVPEKASRDWRSMVTAGVKLATGQYSLLEATSDLQGRAKDLGGKLQITGNDPAFVDIYRTLPAGTFIWSFNNLAYCMLPACNIGRQSANITSPRWYDLPSAGIEGGREILKAQGTNYLFYSTTIPNIRYADTKDVLPALYDGLTPDHIAEVFGIAWTNGTDYLLTWKSPGTKPLDDRFLTSWSRYYYESVMTRAQYFPAASLAAQVKTMLATPGLKHPLPIE